MPGSARQLIERYPVFTPWGGVSCTSLTACKAMAQVASLIANDHEDEATRLFRHGWMLYQQVQLI